MEQLEPRCLLSYLVMEIGGPGATRPYDMNTHGVVVGESDSHAFVWNESSGLIDLGPGIAHGINDAGVIVGVSQVGSQRIATRWMGGTAEYLLPAPGSTDAVALAVTETGMVAGYSIKSPNTVATLWPDPSRPGVPLGALGSRAYDLDQGGRAVGINGKVITGRPTLWELGNEYDLGSFHDVYGGAATAINNANSVVGWSVVQSGNWLLSRAFLWQGGDLVDIGSPECGAANAYAGALDVNDTGLIAGFAGCVGTTGSDKSAVVWSGVGSYERIEITGWNTEAATAVNNAGQIAGWGLHAGAIRGFVLTPFRLDPMTAQALDDDP